MSSKWVFLSHIGPHYYRMHLNKLTQVMCQWFLFSIKFEAFQVDSTFATEAQNFSRKQYPRGESPKLSMNRTVPSSDHDLAVLSFSFTQSWDSWHIYYVMSVNGTRHSDTQPRAQSISILRCRWSDSFLIFSLLTVAIPGITVVSFSTQKTRLFYG